MIKSLKIWALYDDGNHIHCFDTEAEAEQYAMDGSNGLSRYWEISEEDAYVGVCDCGRDPFQEAYDAWYDNREAELKGN